MNEGCYHLADSTQAYIALPSVDAYYLDTGDFTIEAWVKTYSGGPILGIMASENSPGFYLLLNLQTIEVNTQDGTSFARGTASSIPICDGMWHHIAAVRSRDDFVIYLDGEARPVIQSTNGSPPLSINSSDRMTLGAVDSSSSISNQHYDGLLCEVRFWNVARTTDEIHVHASARVQQSDMKNTLIGYWPGIFGIPLDFSATRNTETVHGQLVGSGEAPPISALDVGSLFYVYYGIYQLQSETTPGIWSPARQLALTSTGFVVLNNSTLLEGTAFTGVRLNWSSAGTNNQSSGSLGFKIGSSNPSYWPTKQLGELCEGSMQPNGGSSVNIRGTIMPKRIGCGIALNVGKGLILSNKSGSAVVVHKPSAAPGHFCLYADAKVYDMMSNKALQVHAAGPGHSVSFVDPDPSQDSLQQFELNSDGNIVLKFSPTVALGVDGSNNVVTVPLDNTNDSQRWLALSNAEIMWNNLAESAALSGDGTNVAIFAKRDGSPKQSWYRFRDGFFCEDNARALTVNGAPGVGATLSLAVWSPTNANQQFRFEYDLLTHVPSGLVVLAQGNINNGAALVLADQPSNTGTPGSGWVCSPFAPSFATDRGGIQRDTSTGEENDDIMATFTVSFMTDSSWWSGTSDSVYLNLLHLESRPMGQTGYKYLNNKDHTPPGNPFATGRTATFTYQHPSFGRVDHAYIWYGTDTWFWTSRWVCNRIEVHQSDVEYGYGYADFTDIGHGRSMGTYEYFDLVQTYFAGDATMCLDKAPAQDPICGPAGMDHTWVRVVSDSNPSQRITWFDCAGDHDSPDTTWGVIIRRCLLNDVVKMSTGQPISSTNPLQPTYGTNTTNGVGNANLRCDGWINWDGQCQQIANRYLYMTPSHTSIGDADYNSQPSGYYLSCIAFGRYGVNFPRWCRQIGLTDVPDDAYNNVYTWLQVILADVTVEVKRILSVLLTYRNALERRYLPKPDGPDTVHLVKRLQKEGLDIVHICQALSLSIDEVMKLLESNADVEARVD
ncbi:hypothetical protein AJ80_04795 [Polytolypa hystricis UAMH7299]|uniref:Uncharacterized protein n=1 Tax=Polytolypa hystricis (strain UAMH7299) TaxID=1447883 RepID=A0A2B7Y863_POLH7|nr:hypothetical protein AJ80_04795 [Polytolypa hystricis UAMH7299]